MRAARTDNGKTLADRIFVDPSHISAMLRASDRSALITRFKRAELATIDARDYFGRFAEMCRRTSLPINRVLVPGLVRILICELWHNVITLNVEVKKLQPVSLYHGAVGHEILSCSEFDSLRDTPELFSRAVVGYLSAPFSFLRKVKQDVSELARDPEFLGFCDTPSVFRGQPYTTLPIPVDFCDESNEPSRH